MSNSSQTLTQSTLNSSCSSAVTWASSQTLKTLKFEDIDFNGDARKRRPEVNHAESVEAMRRHVDTVDISVPLDDRVTHEECEEATNNQLPSFSRLLSDRAVHSSMDVQGSPTINPLFSETVSKAPEHDVESGLCFYAHFLGKFPSSSNVNITVATAAEKVQRLLYCSRLVCGSWLY